MERKMTIGFGYQESFPRELMIFHFIELQKFIRDCFDNNHPFWIARMSGIESTQIGRYLNGCLYEDLDIKGMRSHSGILVTGESDWKEFVEMTMKAMTDCDRLAIWDGGCYVQCKEIYEYMSHDSVYNKVCTIPAHSLEPYLFMDVEEYGFSDIFKGKKILIITSHGHSVKSQVENNLDNIFHPLDIFKEKENIIVYKCTQQNGSNSDGYSWKGHYLKMCDDISRFDFDVAFIGCGGFSNLLGYYIRHGLNKSAIYVGGPIQIYFGIIGRRWLGNDRILKHIGKNGAHWILPMKEDYTPGCMSVEEGCYWM